MRGNLRSNAIWAGFGFLITFLLSLRHNILTTSLLRGLVSGLIFFLLIYVARFLIRTVIGDQGESSIPFTTAATGNKPADESQLGRSLDLTTPDEGDELNQLLKPQQPGTEEAFAPLDPPKLSTRITDDPDRMAQALRQMTEE